MGSKGGGKGGGRRKRGKGAGNRSTPKRSPQGDDAGADTSPGSTASPSGKSPATNRRKVDDVDPLTMEVEALDDGTEAAAAKAAEEAAQRLEAESQNVTPDETEKNAKAKEPTPPTDQEQDGQDGAEDDNKWPKCHLSENGNNTTIRAAGPAGERLPYLTRSFIFKASKKGACITNRLHANLHGSHPPSHTPPLVRAYRTATPQVPVDVIPSNGQLKVKDGRNRFFHLNEGCDDWDRFERLISKINVKDYISFVRDKLRKEDGEDVFDNLQKRGNSLVTAGCGSSRQFEYDDEKIRGEDDDHDANDANDADDDLVDDSDIDQDIDPSVVDAVHMQAKVSPLTREEQTKKLFVQGAELMTAMAKYAFEEEWCNSAP